MTFCSLFLRRLVLLPPSPPPPWRVSQWRPTALMQSVANFHSSPAFCAMPTKRKKKADPMLERAREERRKKRLSKALRKMEKKDRIPRPILELEVSPQLLREKDLRKRSVSTITATTEESRVLLQKEWNRFSGLRHRQEIENLDRVLFSQQRALDELRASSLPLYLEAIRFDPELIPWTAKGPTVTPPIPNYLQDGEYHDKTKKFEVQYADMKKFMQDLLRKARKKKRSADDQQQED